MVVSVTLLLVGCSGAAAPSPSPAADGHVTTNVAAALSEFKIELDATSAPAGAVTFNLNNGGTTIHEFVILQTDLAADKLPLGADGTTVDEAGAPGITLVAEVEDIAAGATPNLEASMPAGHYVLICNLPAHYTSGMRAEFTTN